MRRRRPAAPSPAGLAKDRYALAEFAADPAFPLHVMRSPQPQAVAEHTHDCVEVVYVARGTGLHRLGAAAAPHAIGEGDCFVIAPGETHAYSGNDELVLWNILFLPDLVRDAWPQLRELPGLAGFLLLEPLFRAEDGFRERLRVPLAEREAIATTTAAIAEELQARRSGYQLVAKGRFLELLVRLARLHAAGAAALPATGRLTAVEHAIAYMESRFADSLRLEDVAHHVWLSPGYFSELFREATGSPPSDYLMRIRLDAAKRLLRSGERSVTDIALSTGFCDSSHFAKAFRAHEGLSPLAWRRSALRGKG